MLEKRIYTYLLFEGLKEEVKNNEDKLLDSEIKIFKLLTDLEYKKNIMH